MDSSKFNWVFDRLLPSGCYCIIFLNLFSKSPCPLHCFRSFCVVFNSVEPPRAWCTIPSSWSASLWLLVLPSISLHLLCDLPSLDLSLDWDFLVSYIMIFSPLSALSVRLCLPSSCFLIEVAKACLWLYQFPAWILHEFSLLPTSSLI